jgi:diguanylate cyclase (GGDEF)-like protein
VRRENAWRWMSAAGAAIIGGYFVCPQDVQDVLYLVIGLFGTVGMAFGVRIHRPAERLCWYFLIVGNVASIAGDAVENVLYGLILKHPPPSPSIADALYLSAYPFIFAGVLRLCRSSRDRGSLEDSTDAAIVCVAALALAWQFLMGSYVHDSTTAVIGRVINLGYPIMDLGVLFIVVKAFAFGRRRQPVHQILAVAMVSMLVGDFVYDLMVQYGNYSIGDPIDAAWLINYVLMGVAALHPSTAYPLARPDDRRLLQRRRVPVLTLAGYVAPGILLLSSLFNHLVDVPVIAGTTIVLFTLTGARLWWLIDGLRAVVRQREADADALTDALRQREELAGQLRYQAYHDNLTRLANRALLYEHLEAALAEARRSGRAVALLFCDLDGFKAVNDTFGHRFGDQLLTETARRLQAIVRPTDMVARFGGDEFAILLDGLDSAPRASELADRLIDRLGRPMTIDGQLVVTSVSAGVSVGGGASTAEEMLADADKAMYEAKRGGKCRWILAPPAGSPEDKVA